MSAPFPCFMRSMQMRYKTARKQVPTLWREPLQHIRELGRRFQSPATKIGALGAATSTVSLGIG